MKTETKSAPRTISIPHSAPSIGPREEEAVLACLHKKFVGNGTAASALEARIRERTGRKHAFAVSSGFHALLLSVSALDLKPGSRICLPVLTCASVLASVQNTGHRAVLGDVEPETLTLNANDAPKSCVAVIAPHAYGAPVDVAAIQHLGLPWIEDCATSPATIVSGRPAGSWGTLAIFSFASTKYVTGGSGGIVACDDDTLATRIQDMLDYDSFEKNGKWENGWHGAIPGRIPDLNASLAIVQWDRMEELFNRRREIAGLYKERLSRVAGLKLPNITPGHSFYRYIVRTERPSEELREGLRNDGIDARTSVNPWLDRWPSSLGQVEGGPWPAAEIWRRNLLSLPIHPSMSDEDAIQVVDSLRKLVG